MAPFYTTYVLNRLWVMLFNRIETSPLDPLSGAGRRSYGGRGGGIRFLLLHGFKPYVIRWYEATPNSYAVLLLYEQCSIELARRLLGCGRIPAVIGA